ALGALALILPPLREPLVKAVVAGTVMFVEAEFEVEGAAVEALVEETLTRVLAPAASPEAAHHQASSALHRFHRKARARAERWGGDGADRRMRYRRHVAALKR